MQDLEPIRSEGREFSPPITNPEAEASVREQQQPAADPDLDARHDEESHALAEMAREIEGQPFVAPEAGDELADKPRQIQTVKDLNAIIASVNEISAKSPAKMSGQDLLAGQEQIWAAHELRERQRNNPN